MTEWPWTVKIKMHSCGKNRLTKTKKNLNEDRPISTKCRPMILVSRNIRLVRILAGFPRQGAVWQWGYRKRTYLFDLSDSKAYIIMQYAGHRRLFGDPKMRAGFGARCVQIDKVAVFSVHKLPIIDSLQNSIPSRGSRSVANKSFTLSGKCY